MIVCPVCEHAQVEGADCAVCGRRLVEGPADIPVVPPIEGLELTRHAGQADDAELGGAAPHLEVGVVRLLEGDAAGAGVLGELEPTAHAAGPDAAPEPVLVEQTRAAPVDVAVEPTPDLERIGDGIPVDGPTEVPLFVTCRFCRTEAMPGEALCARCGMRLPDFGAPLASAEPVARQCGCGATVRGALCPACGARR